MASILTLPALIGLAFAGGAGAQKGLVNAIPVASASPNASYADGFPILTMTNPTAGGVPPAGADFNGILNSITTFQTWVNAGGQFPFSATLAAAIGGYPVGAVLQLNGGLGCVVNTVNGNTQDPNVLMTGWLPYGGAFPTGQVLVGSGTGTVGNASLTYANGVLKSTDTTACTGTTSGALVLAGGLGLSSTVTNPSATVLCIDASLNATSASTFASGVYAIAGQAAYSGAGNLTGSVGLTGISSTATNSSSGTSNGVAGIVSTAIQAGSGTVTSLYGVTVSVSKSSGSVGTAYGLNIQPVTAGAVNYAIMTGAGIVSLGDTTATTLPTNGAVIIAGGLGVGNGICMNGALSVSGTAGNTLTFRTYVPNGTIGTSMTNLGPTGANATILGWALINIAGANHYMPYW